MANFKIGDRVVFFTKGLTWTDKHGTVCALDLVSVGVAFDEPIGLHNLGGLCKNKHGMWIGKSHLIYETELSSIQENDLMEVLLC